MARRKILIGLNTTWNIVNFRAGLVSALVERGWEVVAVSPPDEYVPRLLALGVRHVPVDMQAQGTSPAADLALFCRYVAIFWRERPDVWLGYTIKPNIYGSLAAHCLRIPVVNTVTGLGTAFLRAGWMTRIVKLLYRLAFSRSRRVFFQNGEDRALFVDAGLVARERTDQVAGSGVDLRRFPAMPMPQGSGRPFRFLLVARLLGDKGVREYVAAARAVKAVRADVEVMLMGALDPRNPDSVRGDELSAWIAEGVVNYVPAGDRVAAEMAAADCVVLPSYREGAPRTLIEAASTGRPMIASDVVGCREVLEDGVNGFFCRARDSDDLARAMLRMLDLDADGRAAMGRNARDKAERVFDERVVIARYVDAASRIANAAAQGRGHATSEGLP